jgi:hypothetical protein
MKLAKLVNETLNNKGSIEFRILLNIIDQMAEDIELIKKVCEGLVIRGGVAPNVTVDVFIKRDWEE